MDRLHGYTAFDCLSSFNPSNRSSHYPGHDRPFTADPSVSVIVFTFEICSPEVLARQIQQFEDDEDVVKGYALSMVVHRQALLSRLPVTTPLSESTLESTVPSQLEVEWEVWGPTGTRWFKGMGMGCTPPHGQRCIDNPIGDIQKSELDVFDFNPWNIKFAHSQVEEGTAPSVLVSVVDGSDPAQNRFSHPGVFPEDIHCCLPYVRRSTLVPQARWCTYITDDYLVNLLADKEFLELDRVVVMKF